MRAKWNKINIKEMFVVAKVISELLQATGLKQG